MIYYSWSRSGTEVLDCLVSEGHYLQFFTYSPFLKWRLLHTDYIPREDLRGKRVPDLYLTLIGVPIVEDLQTP